MKKCAIIVSAWKAQSTILDCIKSIRAQLPLAGWSYELRLGVDGCNITAVMLQKTRVPFYWSRDNIGTYIMANSLIALGPADIYSRFDADDIMFPEYLKTVIPVALQYGISYAGYQLQGGHSKPRVGQVTMTAAALDALGGFAEYRCHSDRDLARRAALLGFDIKAMRQDPRLQTALFSKGMSIHSLTHNAKFGTGSKYRREVRALLAKLREEGKLKIEPKTAALKCQP